MANTARILRATVIGPKRFEIELEVADGRIVTVTAMVNDDPGFPVMSYDPDPERGGLGDPRNLNRVVGALWEASGGNEPARAVPHPDPLSTLLLTIGAIVRRSISGVGRPLAPARGAGTRPSDARPSVTVHRSGRSGRT